MGHIAFFLESTKDDKEKVTELESILAPVGISVSLQERTYKDQVYHLLEFVYDEKAVHKKTNRNAGSKLSCNPKAYSVTIEEIKERMKAEKAEDIAKELGIGRATLFRKLKRAQESGSKYLLGL